MPHEQGFEALGLVRFAGNNRIRVAVDAEGRVFDATRTVHGWQPWTLVNTRAFDAYARAVLRD